jgi:hypothetical protein
MIYKLKGPRSTMVFWVCGQRQKVCEACKIHARTHAHAHTQKGKQLQILDTIIIKTTNYIMSKHSGVVVSVNKRQAIDIGSATWDTTPY